MKKNLFIAIASIAMISLCFTNCKKKNEDTTPSFSMNNTTWAYSIVIGSAPIGTVTLVFTTDKVSGTVQLASSQTPTPIPATEYTYNDATAKGNIKGLDLSGFGVPAKLPLVDFTVSADRKTFTSTALNAALGALGLGITDVVFTKQ